MIQIYQGRSAWSLADVTGWEPYDLHDLEKSFQRWICTLVSTDSAQHLVTADT